MIVTKSLVLLVFWILVFMIGLLAMLKAGRIIERRDNLPSNAENEGERLRLTALGRGYLWLTTLSWFSVIAYLIVIAIRWFSTLPE